MENDSKYKRFHLKDEHLTTSIKALSKISDNINIVKATAGLASETFGPFSDIKELAQPWNQLCKINNYTRITQIPNLYIPKITSLTEEICGFHNKINQLYSDMDEICFILSKYNYLLPLTLPFNIHSDLLEYLKNADESNNEKEIDKILLKLFSNNKWEMTSEIVNKLDKNDKINPKRVIILKDCIKVLKYNSRKTAANTILPVLIAQIDGIWVDILGTKNKDKLKNIIKNMKIDKYANPARELLANILFQYTKTSIPVKSDFCRNKILHGEEVEYGSINNVIRAFLIIEFLDFIKIDNELKYSL